MIKFNKENFGELLNIHRTSHEYSKKEFAELLSTSHILFKDLTQSQVSLWESKKKRPKLWERVCIANLFLCQYEYNIEEIEKEKDITNFKKPQIHNEFGYKISIGNVVTKRNSTIKSDEQSKIFNYHKNVYNEELGMNCFYCEKTAQYTLFYSHDLLIGHVVQCDNIVISIGSQNFPIRLEMMKYLSLNSSISTFPIIDPTLIQFIEDSGTGRIFNINNRTYVDVNLNEFFLNPLAIAIYKGFSDFKYLRYSTLLSDM